jgi:hypothetical protein
MGLSGVGTVMSEIFYCGENAHRVTIREGAAKRPLEPRSDLSNQDTSKFGWGTQDGDPAQLSVALLADALGDDGRALRLQQPFNKRVVSMLPKRWVMSRSRVLAYVRMIERT